MAFEIDNFIDKLASTLAVQGFIETAREIRETIAAGVADHDDFSEDGSARDMTDREQYDLAAEIIERNIVQTYAAWEVSVVQLAAARPNDDGRIVFQKDWEMLFQVIEGGQKAPLGSFDYRKPVSKIAVLIKRLRGMEPPPSPPRTKGPSGSGQSGSPVAENDEHSQYRRTTRKRPRYDVRAALRLIAQDKPLSGWQDVLVEPRIPRPGTLPTFKDQFTDSPFAFSVLSGRHDD